MIIQTTIFDFISTKLKVLELFGGIGACTAALKRLGIDFEVADYVEIDKYAVASYNAINKTNFEPQDITKWDKDIEVDLIMSGSPCQDFSLAGLGKGGDKGSGTRSSLMYENIRIIEKLKPKYVIWENVKNLLSKKHIHNFNAYLEAMEELGYYSYYQVLNAKDYGIPQNRERVFTVSIRKDINKLFTFPPKQELKLKLKDLLEDEVDEKPTVMENHGTVTAVAVKSLWTETQAKMITKEGNVKRYIDSDVVDEFKEGQVADISFPNGYNKGPRVHDECPAINGTTTASSFIVKTKNGLKIPLYKDTKQLRETIEQNDLYKGEVVNLDLYNRSVYEESQALTEPHHNSQRLWDGLRIRKLTPKECWRLMGFTDEDFEKVAKVNSNAQLYKQAGNSIVVNVLMAIFNNLLKGK